MSTILLSQDHHPFCFVGKLFGKASLFLSTLKAAHMGSA